MIVHLLCLQYVRSKTVETKPAIFTKKPREEKSFFYLKKLSLEFVLQIVSLPKRVFLRGGCYISGIV